MYFVGKTVQSKLDWLWIEVWIIHRRVYTSPALLGLTPNMVVIISKRAAGVVCMIFVKYFMFFMAQYSSYSFEYLLLNLTYTKLLKAPQFTPHQNTKQLHHPRKIWRRQVDIVCIWNHIVPVGRRIFRETWTRVCILVVSCDTATWHVTACYLMEGKNTINFHNQYDAFSLESRYNCGR